VAGGGILSSTVAQQKPCLQGGGGTLYFQFVQAGQVKGSVLALNAGSETLAATFISFVPVKTVEFKATNVVIFGTSIKIPLQEGCNPYERNRNSQCSRISFENSTLHCQNTTIVFNYEKQRAYEIRSCGLNADIVTISNNSQLNIYAPNGLYSSGLVFESSENSKISYSTYVYLNFTQEIKVQGSIKQRTGSRYQSYQKPPTVSLNGYNGNITVQSITADRLLIEAQKLTVASHSIWKPLGNNTQNCLSDFNASSSACGGADTSLIPYLRSVKVDKSITIGSYSSIIGSLNLFCAYAFNLQYNSTISADGMGCNPKNGSGAGLPGFYGSSGGGGAGFGGSGGTGYNAPESGGGNYDETGYLYSGSGGGCSVSGGENCDAGSYGGGMIAIYAKQKITLNGTISANGFNGVECSGGGSGGSISLITDTLSGVGVITTNGGIGGTCPWPGGGGGGGYIEIYSPTGAYSTFDLKGASVIASNGGAAGVQPPTSEADYSLASVSSYSAFNVHSLTNSRRKSAAFLQGVTQASAGTAGVLQLPSCQPGHGNDPSTGAICIICPTGTYSYGGNVECSNCNDKPSHSFYTQSGWSNSDCPFQCESGYTTDSCYNPLQAFIFTTLTVPGVVGISVGLLAIILVPLFYYRYKRFNDWGDKQNEQGDFFKKVLFNMDMGNTDEQGNKKASRRQKDFMVQNPLRGHHKNNLSGDIEEDVKIVQIRHLQRKRGKEMRREYRMADSDMIFHACRVNLYGQNHPYQSRGNYIYLLIFT
jgi:hypothetical protein